MSSVLVYSEREAVRLELLTGAGEIARSRAVSLLQRPSWDRAQPSGPRSYFAHGAEQVFVAEDPMLEGAADGRVRPGAGPDRRAS